MGQIGDLSPQASIALGILVGLLSTSVQSLGLTLQRKSHLLEDAKDDYEARRPPYRRTRWQLGMSMFVLSNLVGSTIQITTLPLPVLSTLQASGLVFNTAFATLLLKEPFTRFSLVGTILTCTGAALIATFGAIAEPAHSLDQLLDLLVREAFVVWMIVTFIIAIGTLVFARFLKYWSKRIQQSHTHSKHEQSPSTSRSKSRPRSLSISLPHVIQLRTSRLRLLRGLAYALVSGILSAHSLLVAKSAVELLVRTIVDRVNQFDSYQSWLILLALILLALSQLYYLHEGLCLCSTSVLYPFVFCIYNIIAILDGLIYFHQLSRLSIFHACLVALGTLILLSGVLALSWRLDDAPPSEPQTTLLGPRLGLASSVSEGQNDSPTSPLLPTARPRSSTSKRSSSIPVNESTPLLSSRQSSGRRPNVMIYPPAPEAGNAQHIWAELDDSGESDRDVLASLPRSTSPFLSSLASKTQRRSRRSSLLWTESPSTYRVADRSWDRPSSDTRKRDSSRTESPKLHHRPPPRSQTLKERTHQDKRRSSAPSTSSANGSRSSSTTSIPPVIRSPSTSLVARSKGNTVRGHAESPGRRHGYRDRVRARPRSATEAPRAVPSRWDMSGAVARWWEGQSQGRGQEHSQARDDHERGEQDNARTDGNSGSRRDDTGSSDRRHHTG